MQGRTTTDDPPVHEFVLGAATTPSVEPFDWDVFHAQLNQAADQFEARLAGAAAAYDAQLRERAQAFAQESDVLHRQLLASGQALVQAQQRLSQDLRTLAWKSLALALGTALLLVAGTGWIAYQNTRIAHDARLDTETSRLLRSIRIGACGQRACVKLDSSAPRWGKHRDYILLDAPTDKDATP